MEENVFTAKTVDEAIEEGLKTLGITLVDADIEVLEEGKKKLFGSIKAKVRITKKQTDAERAAEFIDGLLSILGIGGNCEVVSDEESVKIEIKTANSARVIGKRGDVLDAIQCMAGAVANIGREEYKKVVVDCENYREQREETLKALAAKLAARAIETGRKLMLEPMNPYERRIIHASLVDNPDVKTVSEGREPARYIVVIPNNAKPYDKGLRYGERRERGDRRFGDRREQRGGRGDKKFGERREHGERSERGDRGERKFGGRDERRSGGRPTGGSKRGKKQIYFGTYLGNSNANKSESENEEDKSEE